MSGRGGCGCCGHCRSGPPPSRVCIAHCGTIHKEHAVIAGYSLADLALILGGGVVAGVLNVAAAGGSLVSFLALSATGVPVLTANATNLAATPASFIGTVPTTVRTSREHQHNTIP